MRISVLVALCLISTATTVWGQGTSATISGTVKDSTGAVLPSARVVLLNEDTGISRTVQTDEGGRYTVPSLSLGNYRVTASIEGFQTEVRRGIVLTVGREAVVDLSLSVGSVTQTVEVSGEAPLVELTTSSLGSLVDERTIRALPLNGRSYDQLALLQPGVVLTAPGRDNTGNFQYGSGRRFSVGGSRPNTNSFLLDGTDINDQANSTPGGAAGTNLGVDTIREFKILTNGFSAEFGRGSGAVVTAVTRGGTNEYHGSAFEYLRNSALDARNFFDNRPDPPPFRRNQFGGTFGGPIKRDHTFFFGGYEGLRQGLGTTQSATIPTVAIRQGILPNGTVVPVSPAIVPFLRLWPVPNGNDFRDGTAEYLSAPTVVTNQDNVMIRVDHQLNEKTSLFGRYTFDNDSVDAPGSNPNFKTFNSSRRQYSTIQANTVISAKALNHFHFAYNRSFQNNDSLPTIDLGPEYSFVPGERMGSINIGAVQGTVRAIAGIGPGFPRFFGYHLFEWSDDFSYVAGKHSIKTGANIRRIRDNTAISSEQRGAYTFTTFNDLLAATPANFSAAGPGLSAYRGYRQTIYGLYVQDDVSVTSRLTVNLGLRWEAITDPVEVNGKTSVLLSPMDSKLTVSDQLFHTGKKNFEPRVGFAWRLNDTGTTVVRAGGGIYHNHILPVYYAGPSSQLPPFYALLQANNPPFPNGYQTLVAGGGLPRLKAFEPSVKTPTSYQYNLAVEQQISGSTVIQAAYAGRSATHLLVLSEANPPPHTFLADGRKFFLNAPRQNPNFDSIETYNANSNASYHAVSLTLRRQSSSGMQYQVFYTFAKAMDIVSGLASAETGRSAQEVLDPEDLKRDWGPSDFDARHNFNVSFAYPLPFRFGSRPMEAVLGGWSLSGISTFTSGLPLSARLATNNSRDGALNAPDRPDLKPQMKSSNTEGTTAGCGPVPAGQLLGTPTRFFDPCVFSFPTAGTYGNVGRNTIQGPGLMNVDLSVEKNFRLSESGNVRFRAEVFNIMNHANFDLPNTQVFTTSGGYSGSAGRITRTVTPSRQLQFALRINF